MSDVRTRVGFLTMLLLVVPGLVPSPARAGATTAAIAFHTDDGSRVADLLGATVFDKGAFDFMSLGGNVFAGSPPSGGSSEDHIVAFDASTGERLFRIDNAFAPVVLAGGKKVAFWPDHWARRDPYGTSVWIRNAEGNERRVFQLTGPRATVPRDPFEGDAVPLSMAFDAEGKKLAVAMGNDLGLLIYDIWVVKVRTREAVRVTKGKASHWPSLSPSGAQLAVLREVEMCPGEIPRLAWTVQVMASSGEDKRTLLEGSCDLYYADARWISESELVTVRIEKTAEGDYTHDLVKVDAVSGETTDLVADGDITYFTVSPSLQKVAFHRSSDFPDGGFSVFDLITGEITDHPAGFIPRLSGESRLI